MGKGKRKKVNPNFYISKEGYRELVGPGRWKVCELSSEHYASIKEHFGNSGTVHVHASGTGVDPIDQSEQGGRVGGIDWIRLEAKPKPGEPSLNVDHFEIGPPDDKGYPVYGPFKEGGRAPHWLEESEDLSEYYGDDNGKHDMNK